MSVMSAGQGGGAATRVSIVGLGPIALSTAAYLVDQGRQPLLWSPKERWHAPGIRGYAASFEGRITGPRQFPLAGQAADLAAWAETIVICLPGKWHKQAMDALAPHLTPRHRVIISSHCSFGAQYLRRSLASAGVEIPIIAWSTTLATCNPLGDRHFKVMTLRRVIDVATTPRRLSDEGLAVSIALFGPRFQPRDGVMAIAVSNVNPQNHLAICLCNLTRMEQGEVWNFNLNITETVSRLIDALDAERIGLASDLGVAVRTVREHWHYTHDVPVLPIHEATRAIEARGISFFGQRTHMTPWVLEDAPYGLAPLVALGEMAGRDMPLHRAGLALLSALYGRDFAAENDLLAEVRLSAPDLTTLRALSE
ncbi:MAG: NAD/NADP octopine/nopaline dehydrogenase [Rhodovulum sulfidophilum]|uniref:NAD/NADP octopine/nopaline dehydrogenase n=1 Tax=Rhodovulum sulfidophilum TaxID=35806 RepID=A0A2W5Q636_RHOSU|nr:MAG: NAD/NADP octopine/nopaline dehydrogenase [Rhodovulum sulfidophilum]